MLKLKSFSRFVVFMSNVKYIFAYHLKQNIMHLSTIFIIGFFILFLVSNY